MKRTEKIELLTGIKDGSRSVHELRPPNFFILDCGILKEFGSGKEITIDRFCKRFVPAKDMVILFGYTFHNLPAECNHCDPSGAVFSEIVKVFPELAERFSEFIEEAKDLRKTELYQDYFTKIMS